MYDPIPFKIELDYVTFSGWRWGKGNGQTVIALHGWLDNCASFARIAPGLAAECDLDIWALDLAGHGHSGFRPQGSYYHIWDNVLDLALLMDAQGWESIDLLGHSMGAAVATLMAGAMPDRVGRVALLEGIGPVATAAEDAPSQLAQAAGKYQLLGYKTPSLYASVEDAAEARMKGVGEISYEAALPLAKRGVKASDDGYLWRYDARLRIPSPVRLTEDQINHFCAAIDAPVCLITAEHGFLIDRENTRTRSAHVKDLICHCLPGNHHFHLEPDSCTEVLHELVSFWNGLETE
ncbi:alpha/beta fold hydrolase [Oceanospirillum sediminis]|uniref:Alpha/beta fold hydrolase n=1 Tax=Oceanospirillum sediminis TaxID=2760088 RepID=A0A839IPX8_9GAMM|nr:alpha/beta fold hydrolase [Oceanospirillum sediminis]MBB1487018.1 alpha/beta fold hydrolase [Oceanospirillum sediminis]